MTNLITKPESENSIYSIRQQIQALGFTCSTINSLPHSLYLTFTIKTTDGDIAIGTTLIKGQLAFTQPHQAIIFIDSHKVVANFKERLDLRTKPDVKAESGNSSHRLFVPSPTQYCSDKDLWFYQAKAEEQGERSRERGFCLSPLLPAPRSHAASTENFGYPLQYCSPTFPSSPLYKTKQTIFTFSDEKFYRVDKKLYPSVTTVLAHTMPEAKRKSLEFWRRKVGEEQAEQIKEEAIARGQKIHQLLENYAHGKETQCPPELTPFCRQALATVQSFKRIFCTEEFLYHPQLQYAGTTDLIADVEDIPTIIDYKTSSKPKNPSYMEDAKIQGTAYALACQACKQIYIPQVLILVIHPHGTQEFWLKEQQREEYVEKWLQRLESYLAQPVPISRCSSF